MQELQNYTYYPVQKPQTDNSELSLTTQPQPIKLYKIWPGKNRFYMNGLCMTGPIRDIYPNIYTHTIVQGFSILYWIYIFPYLVTQQDFYWVCYVNIFLYALTCLFLFITQFSDPGIIPRKSVLLITTQRFMIDQEFIKDYQNTENEKEFGQINNSLRSIIVQPNNLQTNQKFCETCQIIKAPRSSHCKDCDNCVLVFDHHCPFVNNCIGKRNYKYFISFLASLIFLITSYTIGLSVTGALNPQFKTNADNKNDQSNQISTFFIPIMVFLGLLGAILLGGISTKEIIKNIQLSTDADGQLQKFDWFNNTPQLFNPRQIVYI